MYTIGDFLIRIKNASLRGAKQVVAPYSRAVTSIAKILQEQNYIKGFSVVDKDSYKEVVIELMYTERRPAIRKLFIVSKPSHHVFVSKAQMVRYRRQSGIAIVSTNKGMMASNRAGKLGLGGEVICELY